MTTVLGTVAHDPSQTTVPISRHKKAASGAAAGGCCSPHRARWRAARPQHKTFFQGRGDRHLNAKLVRSAGFAFGDAFNFRGMKGIELVFVFGALGQNPLATRQQILQCLIRAAPATASFAGLCRAKRDRPVSAGCAGPCSCV